MICKILGHKVFAHSANIFVGVFTGSRYVFGPFENCLRCGKEVV